MRIDKLTAEHRQAYDELVLARDDTLLYQSSRYMSLLEDLLG